MSSDILIPFAGALQASLSVLLVIFYGVVVTQLGWLSQSASKDVSVVCVRFFLPALLLVNVGATVTRDTFSRYIPVFIWSAIYNVVSITFGIFATRVLRFPGYVTPAIAFNNTTSLPILLVQCLQSTGVLSAILVDENDSVSDAVERATSYFLINSMIGNCLSFAVGSGLSSAHTEDAPKRQNSQQNETEPNESDAIQHEQENNVVVNDSRPSSTGDYDYEVSEETSLLPDSFNRQQQHLQRKGAHHTSRIRGRLPKPVLTILDITWQLLNGPLFGMLVGLVVGLNPPLQKACFADLNNGGYLHVWLVKSLQQVGGLFSALQTLTVGTKLSKAALAVKAGKSEEQAGSVPWLNLLFVEGIRNIVWPAISIPTIWAVASKTSWLADDPVLWFCMMLAPVGPPALKLLAVADVSDASEGDKMTIAKFLAVSYVVSPIISLSVVGSLKASSAAMGTR